MPNQGKGGQAPLTIADFRRDLAGLMKLYPIVWEWHKHAVDLIRIHYRHIREECLLELGETRRRVEGDRRGGGDRG